MGACQAAYNSFYDKLKDAPGPFDESSAAEWKTYFTKLPVPVEQGSLIT